MDIYTPEYECEDLDQLLRSILEHLDRNDVFIPSSPSKTEFMTYASALPDLIYGVLSPIARKPINCHRYLWVKTLEFVVVRAGALVKLYRDILFHSRPDNDINHVVHELKAILNNLSSFLKSFLGQAESEFLEIGSSHGDAIRQSFVALLRETLEMIVNGKDIAYDEECMASLASTITNMASFVDQKKYKDFEQKLISQHDILPLIVDFCRASYTIGAPEKVEPLFVGVRPIISERFPFNLTTHLDTDLPLLMDFYKYAGFCLVTLAVLDPSASHIKSEYADLANNFLVPLLTLPNLSLSNYTTNELAGNPGAIASSLRSGQYILDKEREEISFFYVLSYLLRLRRLSTLVEPVPRFKAEVRYFASSFGRRISSDLDILASSHQSYSNSTISMLSLEQRASTVAPAANANTMSSILYEGTYKEKLHLVKIFFETLSSLGFPHLPALSKLIQVFNFKSVPEGSLLTSSMRNQDFHHLLTNVDIVTYPGKKLYVEAIEKIIRLVQILTLKHLHTTLGLDTQPNELLTHLFKTTYTFEQISEVQDHLRVDGSGKVFRSKNLQKMEESEIASQFDMILATRDLEQVMR